MSEDMAKAPCNSSFSSACPGRRCGTSRMPCARPASRGWTPRDAPTRRATRKSACGPVWSPSAGCRSAGRSTPTAAARTPVSTCYARKYQRHLELGAGARLLLADSRQDEPARSAAARGRPRRVDARDRGGRHRHGSLSAHRRPLPHHPAMPRGVDRLRDAVLDRDEGPDGGARRRRARTGDGGAGCQIYMSVPTVDEAAWARLEPGTAPPAQRLRALRTLSDAGSTPPC